MTNVIKDSCSNAVKSYAAVEKPDAVASNRSAAETANDLQKAIKKSKRGAKLVSFHGKGKVRYQSVRTSAFNS